MTNSDCVFTACAIEPCGDPYCALGADGVRRCISRDHLRIPACLIGLTEPCCSGNADCTDQAHGVRVSESENFRGGIAPPLGNQCAYDACQDDADCTAMRFGVCTAEDARWERFAHR